MKQLGHAVSPNCGTLLLHRGRPGVHGRSALPDSDGGGPRLLQEVAGAAARRRTSPGVLERPAGAPGRSPA